MLPLLKSLDTVGIACGEAENTFQIEPFQTALELCPFLASPWGLGQNISDFVFLQNMSFLILHISVLNFFFNSVALWGDW